MKTQRLYSLVRQAVQDYNMIADGDRIAVGISGGKDSLALLYALAGLRRFYPVTYSLAAVTVDLGLAGMDYTPIETFCRELSVDYHIVRTEISHIVFKEREEKSPCSLCAKMRKGALNQKAISLGCNKTAYAHHMDDMIETALMSLLYEGRFYCFPPVTLLDRTELSVIRPLMYVRESEIWGFVHKNPLPIVENTCPADSITKRTDMKHLIRQLRAQHPTAEQHIFHAIQTANLPDWPQKIR